MTSLSRLEKADSYIQFLVRSIHAKTMSEIFSPGMDRAPEKVEN
jgi:hypothetical protein